MSFLLETGAFILSVIKWLSPHSSKECLWETTCFLRNPNKWFLRKEIQESRSSPMADHNSSADAADKFADKTWRDFHRGTLLLKQLCKTQTSLHCRSADPCCLTVVTCADSSFKNNFLITFGSSWVFTLQSRCSCGRMDQIPFSLTPHQHQC